MKNNTIIFFKKCQKCYGVNGPPYMWLSGNARAVVSRQGCPRVTFRSPSTRPNGKMAVTMGSFLYIVSQVGIVAQHIYVTNPGKEVLCNIGYIGICGSKEYGLLAVSSDRTPLLVS